MPEQISPIQEPKLELNRQEKQELKLYFFIARQPNIEVQNEKVIAVLAYELESALLRGKQEAKELNIIYHGQAIPIREVIEKIYIEGVLSPPTTTEKLPEIPREKLSIEQFKAGLVLAAENLCQNEEQKKQLKELIENLKVGKEITK